jgi:hypothetical protein
MSRGPGDLQRLILAYLSESTVPVTTESMRWSLYEHLGTAPTSPDGTLPNRWNTSFARAVNSLASESRSLLHIERRPLTSLEECIAHYPGKTLQVAVRRQRQELLPALLEWTQETYGASPRYGAAANEQYFVERLPPDRAMELRSEWCRLESVVRPAFAESGSDDLFLLLVKGRSLFYGLDVELKESFTELAKQCQHSGRLSLSAACMIRKFADELLSIHDTGSLELKSFVHEFAKVPTRGQCSLRRDTMEALHRLRKPFVESLPGFEPAQPRGLRDAKHSDALDKLFDQTVFQKFNFVSRAA